jgi:calcium-dependent protein kinase
MIMKQAFSALHYLHQNKISHRYAPSSIIAFYRDIKPENFLLKNKEDITNIKLIDFGLSKDYSETKVMQNPKGSVIYNMLILCVAILHSPRGVRFKLQ